MVSARVGNEVFGALLVRRQVIESEIAKSFDPTTQRALSWPRRLSAHCDDWLFHLEETLGQWLLCGMEFAPKQPVKDDLYYLLPDGPEAERFRDELDRIRPPSDDILDLLEKASLEELGRCLWLPSVLLRLQHLKQKGTPTQRKRVKSILRSWAPGEPGAPLKKLQEREDVGIARRIVSLRSRLEAGFDYCRTARKAGGYASDAALVKAELRQRGYDDMEVDAIWSGKTLVGAAQQMVARETRRRPASVRAMASRGKKYLKRS